MLLKTNMDQDEDCILGLSTTMVAKKLKELIKKDNLTIADLEGAGLEMLKRYAKPDCRFYNSDFYYLVYLSMEKKYTSSQTKHYVARYYIEGIEDMISDKWSKEVHLYHVDALNDLSRLSLNDIEDMYLLKVQGKLHHLKLEFEIDFINSLLLYIRRRVEVHKFCDGTLLKVQDNLLKMLNENNLGHKNVKLEGREWTKNDIKRSEAMLEKIDKTLKHIE
ncbi:hypothetical protein Tco_1335690 [Tanacetum coccineum]